MRDGAERLLEPVPLFGRTRPLRGALQTASEVRRVDLVAFAETSEDAGGTRPHAARRDLRIDALRGLALLMIYVDHIKDNLFARLTYQQFGFSNTAWFFVLLSGISFALKHERLIARRGLGASLLVALRRAQTIYGAHLVSLVLALGAWLSLIAALGRGRNDLSALSGFEHFLSEPLSALTCYLTLSYQPQFFDVLQLYLLLVCAGPLMLWGLRTSPRLTTFASLAAYALVQIRPDACNLPAWHAPSGWSFTPLGWQLVFFLGLAIGTRRFPRFRDVQTRRVVVGLSLAFVLVAAATRLCASIDVLHDALGGESAPWLVGNARRAVWLEQVHPLTIVHALAVLTLLNVWCRPDAAWLRSRWMRPFIELGRHSLEVFATGSVLTVLATELVVALRPSLLGLFAINLAGCLLLWGVARFLTIARSAERIRTLAREMPAVAREAEPRWDAPGSSAELAGPELARVDARS
ncbi:MAG TPA: OpgC domain-containing protein [Polyangiales bacterium]